MFMLISTVWIALVSSLHLWRRMRFFLYNYQASAFVPAAYQNWLGLHPHYTLTLSHLLGGAWVAVTALGLLLFPKIFIWLAPLGWTVCFYPFRGYSLAGASSVSPRSLRVLGPALLFASIFVLGGGFLWYKGLRPPAWAFYLLGWLIADFGAPLWLRWGARWGQPLERFLLKRAQKKAQRQLARLPHIQQIAVLAPYDGFATKSVISQVLNQAGLEVFCAEEGADAPYSFFQALNAKLKPLTAALKGVVYVLDLRFPKDIPLFLGLGKTEVYVLRALDVFQATLSTKTYQTRLRRVLARVAPQDLVILPSEEDEAAFWATQHEGQTWLTACTNAPSDLAAQNIQLGVEGTGFEIQGEQGQIWAFSMPLLGVGHVQEVLIALSIGLKMGLTMEEMQTAVSSLSPLAHHLQRRAGTVFGLPEGVDVLDQTEEIHVAGATEALQVLGSTTTGRRFILTNGVADLSHEAYEVNYALGEALAQHTDYAFLLDEKHSLSILAALRDQKFPEGNLFFVPTWEVAFEQLRSMTQAGDVVLLENIPKPG